MIPSRSLNNLKTKSTIIADLCSWLWVLKKDLLIIGMNGARLRSAAGGLHHTEGQR